MIIIQNRTGRNSSDVYTAYKIIQETMLCTLN